MSARSMDSYRVTGDFEGAKERYESTSRRWKGAWWDVLCEIWDNFTKWQSKYSLDKVAMTIIEIVEKAVKKRKSKPRADIIEKVPITFAKGTKLCYLFKFYDSNNELVYTKVGTTERTIRERLSEELRQYRKNCDISHATVESVFDTGELFPEGVQDYIKGMWMRKYNKYYVRNDRFTCDIPTEDFNALVTNYLAA